MGEFAQIETNGIIRRIANDGKRIRKAEVGVSIDTTQLS